MNDEQLLRYSRHILMPSMDFEGQQALIDSTVLIVGAGGLGCPAALYLAAAGVGRLILVDFDHVELTNLQRQIAHGMADIGQAKTASLQQSIQAINPDVEVVCLNGKIEELDLTEWVAKIDVVLECSDNLISRYHSNQFCHNHNLPLVSGAAIGFSAQVSVFNYQNGPCYQCLYPDGHHEQLTCAQSGVISPLVGIVGSFQALECVKIIAGMGEVLAGRLAIFDAMTSQWSNFKLKKNQHCPCCGTV